MCRGIAEKEYMQAKATVAHYERLVRDARFDVAAFSRAADDVTVPSTPEKQDAARDRALRELQQAQEAILFARPGDELVLDVLRRLVLAGGPILDASS